MIEVADCDLKSGGSMPGNALISAETSEHRHDSNLKSHIATSSSGLGERREPPLVFTEHGALQAAKEKDTSRFQRE